MLVDEDNRVLLLRRHPNAKLGGDLWGLPAGKIEPGESPDEAADRERCEEIGDRHEVTLARYVGPFRDTYYGGQYEIHLFHFQWHSGQVTLNDEHTAFAWVGRESWREYAVMDGLDEDLAILGIWPREFLRDEKIPDYLK
ncbi:MAG: NUDIX domain-containing protein [Pseudomonadota bacterium]